MCSETNDIVFKEVALFASRSILDGIDDIETDIFPLKIYEQILSDINS